MSFEQACETLNIKMDRDSLDTAAVRRAYFKLAAIYHPDKLSEDKRDKEAEYRDVFNKVCYFVLFFNYFRSMRRTNYLLVVLLDNLKLTTQIE